MRSISKRATRLWLCVAFGLMGLTAIPASAQVPLTYTIQPDTGPPGTDVNFVGAGCPRGTGAFDGTFEVFPGATATGTPLSTTGFVGTAGGAFVGSTGPLPTSTAGVKATRVVCTSVPAQNVGSVFTMTASPATSTSSTAVTSSTSSSSSTSTTRASTTTTSTTMVPPTSGGGGARLGVINSCAATYVKEGFLTNGFWPQLNCGDSRAMALADTRVAVVNGCGAYYVKQGPLNNAFTSQTGCNDASAIAVSPNRNGVINGCGAAFVKEGAITGSFVQQLSCFDGQALALTDNRVGVVNACSAFFAKEGSLSGGFSQQTSCGDARAIAVSPNRVAVING
ncbi:MAG: hypothetical protein QOI56_1930, partial [Actinomycetota bacterium]|nr:hypothetical protein [Actinomycetota bacterium]